MACAPAWPSAFNGTLDLISLHYDCAADPDDMESAVADRTILETRFGTSWLQDHVIAVGGTYGTNTDYLRSACERVLQATWGDAGVLVLSAGAEQSESRAMHRALRQSAVERAVERYKLAIAAGGRVYAKEGGQSDFSYDAAQRVEAWSAGAARCMHVVQHASWNEQTASAGVLVGLQSISGEYVRISDGNTQLQRANWARASEFVAAARASWLGCALELTFLRSRPLIRNHPPPPPSPTLTLTLTQVRVGDRLP